MDDLHRVGDAARQLGADTAALYRLIDAGHLEAVTRDGLPHVSLTAARDALAREEAPGTAAPGA